MGYPWSNRPAKPNTTVPHAAARGDVHAVADVAADVGEVDEQRLAEVLDGGVVVADLGGDDRLDARREGRVAGGERVVVVEVAPLLLQRNSLPSRNIASTMSACLITWWR